MRTLLRPAACVLIGGFGTVFAPVLAAAAVSGESNALAVVALAAVAVSAVSFATAAVCWTWKFANWLGIFVIGVPVAIVTGFLTLSLSVALLPDY
jgi:hypothetical protein